MQSPITEEEWEHFHFPSKQELLLALQKEEEVRLSRLSKQHEQQLLQEKEVVIGPSRWVVQLDAHPEEYGWVFVPESMKLVNRRLGRKLELKKWNDVDKLVRYLTIVKNKQELEPSSLERALDRACHLVLGISLTELLTDYPAGTELDWSYPDVHKEA